VLQCIQAREKGRGTDPLARALLIQRKLQMTTEQTIKAIEMLNERRISAQNYRDQADNAKSERNTKDAKNLTKFAELEENVVHGMELALATLGLIEL
jgi:hypothetical protein